MELFSCFLVSGWCFTGQGWISAIFPTLVLLHGESLYASAPSFVSLYSSAPMVGVLTDHASFVLNHTLFFSIFQTMFSPDF
jgi:hypothetical protein